jgi:type I restriction enzyme S subunit
MSRQPENSPPAKGERREAGRGLVPRLRFPEFREDGEWSKEKLGAVASLHKGKGISKAEIVANGVHPCIRYGELYTIYGETIHETISSTNVDASELFLSKRNDVIIPASGETKIDIAKASCVMSDDIALGGDLNVIRSSQNGIFFSYQLNGPLRLSIAKVAQGDTVVHLYPTQIGQLDVLIPSLNEQQKIADCLTSLDDLITAEAQKLDTLKVHKKGLMQQLFPSEGETVPKLRFPEFREAEEWNGTKLGQIGAFTGGGTPSKDKASYWAGTNPWVSSSDISDENIQDICISRFISDEAIQETATKIVPANSILLISRVGVGKLAITRKPICTSQDFTNFTPAKDNLVFLAYCLKSLKDTFLAFNQGMAIKGFTKDDAFNLIIPLPIQGEQQKIASCLSSLDDLITAQTQKLAALKVHKKGLMQQLFPHTPR